MTERRFLRLEGGGGHDDVDAVLDAVLDGGPEGPRVVAIMIASIDGRTAVAGRSGPLGHPADRELLRALRGRADAVLVGPKTLAVEGYRNLLDEQHIEQRRVRGQAAHPLVVTISRSGNLPANLALLDEPGTPVHVFAGAEPQLPKAVAAELSVSVVSPEELSPQAVLAQQAQRGVGLVVCEGGPTLLGAAISGGVVDDLVLTISPQTVGGDGPTLLSGAPHTDSFRLAGSWRAESHLFLHYKAERAGE